MPEFPWTQHALKSPTRCLTCQTTAADSGFFDTLVEIPGYGAVYLCVSCVEQAAVKAGCLTPAVRIQWEQAAEDREAEIQRLAAVVEYEQGHKTISAADLAGFLRGHGPVASPVEIAAGVNDALVCPECGEAKGAASQRCKRCSMNAARAAKAGATA